MLLLLTPLLFGLSFLSGMLGLGVAFIAIPVLGLFGYDLKDVIQPWALLLNGLTAISGAIAFWRAGMVDKRGALILVTITTIGAPLGVWLLQFASVDFIWWLYVGVLLFLAARMALPKGASTEIVAEITDRSRAKAAGAAVPISVFAGFLGVGPGFLLMPTLTLVGYSARLAAATNSGFVNLPAAAVREAVMMAGVEAEIVKVTDYAQIAAHGVLSTPGLVIDGKLVSTGRVLSAGHIAVWLSE